MLPDHIETYFEAAEIRRHLKPVKSQHKPIHSNRKGRNIFEENNAFEAAKLKHVPQRVRSVVTRGRFFRHLGCVHGCSENTSKQRAKDNAGISSSQHCEVLGPNYCSKCLKDVQKNKYENQLVRSYPSVKVNARSLCISSDNWVYFPNPWDVAITANELQHRVMERNRLRAISILPTEKSTLTSFFLNKVEYPDVEKTSDDLFKTPVISLPPLERFTMSKEKLDDTTLIQREVMIVQPKKNLEVPSGLLYRKKLYKHLQS